MEKKNLFLTSFFLLIENFTIRQANSINLVSKGFNNAYKGWEEVITKKNISLTYFPNGISKDFKEKIQKKVNISKNISNKYTIIYCGNLGIGQNIFKLVKNIYIQKNLLNYFKKNKIKLEIYGSGSEKNEIQSIINKNNISKSISNGIIEYKGLIKKEEVPNVYINKNCLLIQIAEYNPLSMVIPSKVFEYAATTYPIIFYAKGFCFEFISKISGTIPYELSEPKTLIEALEKVKTIKIDFDQRKKFLKKFDSDTILKNYAKYISSAY